MVSSVEYVAIDILKGKNNIYFLSLKSCTVTLCAKALSQIYKHDDYSGVKDFIAFQKNIVKVWCQV